MTNKTKFMTMLEKSTAAHDAIRDLKEKLDRVNNAIKNDQHITFEWYTEHAAEEKVYLALKDYEETKRIYDRTDESN